MNIKSLLLGSAAALVAVSGARAADAIVAAEPEPVEYVRVCDAFGTGYFYIPGTETCLRIGGYVRTDIFGGMPYGQQVGFTSGGNQTYNIRTRASLRFYTASETELGALRTYVETRFQWDTNTAPAGQVGYTNDNEWNLNHAWVQLGGLRIGMGDSFFTTWTGYAGSVINDYIIPYGRFSTNFISYTYTGGAFRAGIALEQGDDNSTALPAWGIDDYMPHVVVGLGATFGMVDLSGALAWDSRNGAGNGGWSGKVRADVKFNDAASAFLLVLYGQNNSAYTTWANGGTNTLAVIGGGSYAFNDKATFNMQAGWRNGTGVTDSWHVVGNVSYALVPGLTITPEVTYSNVAGAGSFGGGVRVQRSF